MNRKELNMSKNTNTNQTVNEQKGKRIGLTILGYLLVIVALLTVLPVVLPPIFGYHTYLSGTDHTGNHGDRRRRPRAAAEVEMSEDMTWWF